MRYIYLWRNWKNVVSISHGIQIYRNVRSLNVRVRQVISRIYPRNAHSTGVRAGQYPLRCFTLFTASTYAFSKLFAVFPDRSRCIYSTNRGQRFDDGLHRFIGLHNSALQQTTDGLFNGKVPRRVGKCF